VKKYKYCYYLLNFTCKITKKPHFRAGGTPTVVAQSSAQARLRPRPSLCHKFAKKAQFPRGGTPTVVAQFKHVVSLSLPYT
jgi:hypothetical protein